MLRSALLVLVLTTALLAAPVSLDTLTFQPPPGWTQQKGPEYWGSPTHDAALHITAVPGASQMIPEGEKDPLAHFLKSEQDGLSGWTVTRSGNITVAGEPGRFFEATATEEDGRLNSQTFYLCLHKDTLVEYQIKFRRAAGPDTQKIAQSVLKSIHWK